MAEGKVGMCVECEDVPACVRCTECTDIFCTLCFQWLHKSGKRRQHTAQQIEGAIDYVAQNVEGTTEHFMEMHKAEPQAPAVAVEAEVAAESGEAVDAGGDLPAAIIHFNSAAKVKERAQYTPIRLSDEERVLLRLLEGALEVSEYTDKVDVSNDMYGWRTGGYSYSGSANKKEAIIKHELNDIFSIVSGLIVANNFRSGSRLTKNKNFEDNAEVFQRIFELGRRFKIMNPSKMRSTYGKMMHLLQDANQPGMLTFSCVTDIKTVYSVLEAKGGLGMLDDPRVQLATCVIRSSGVTREQVQEARRQKEAARDALLNEYAGGELSRDDIELCLSSISDSNSFLTANREPVDHVLGLLTTMFKKKVEADDDPFSLSIRAGKGGSCLTHSHPTQYRFVLQSLTLWREIQHEMPVLWFLTDRDLLSPTNRYRLCNTGQGLNRVQPAPSISRAMSAILGRVQSRLGGWVGLSVVHLGDRDVPNALVFIDKYTQVPRILGPIARTVENLRAMAEDEHISQLINNRFKGVEDARRLILRDFFRYGFDGSGSDGGSCVDGRLTSCWNWCSKLDKKVYYWLFLLACFDGFDGDWKSQ